MVSNSSSFPHLLYNSPAKLISFAGHVCISQYPDVIAILMFDFEVPLWPLDYPRRSSISLALMFFMSISIAKNDCSHY